MLAYFPLFDAFEFLSEGHLSAYCSSGHLFLILLDRPLYFNPLSMAWRSGGAAVLLLINLLI